MAKTIHKILDKAREVLRSPAAVKVLAVVAGAACFGAAGATQAFADQPGDAWIVAADGSDGRDITNCDPHFVYQNGAKGEQVFCVELGYADQSGTGTSYELVGALSRRARNHDGEQIEPEWHTWTQDDVTNVALMHEWAWSRFGTFRERWGYYQRMLWSYCNSGWNLDDMTTYYSFPFEEGSEDSRAVVEYVKANKSSKTGHGILYCPDNGDTTQRSIRVWVTENTGQAKLQKTSANAALTDNNPNYSLEGAVYDVYGNSACTGEAVATLTTGEDGNTDTVELAPGTYWVKERTASKGYELCADAHKVTVAAGQTATVSCSEKPVNDPIGVSVYKQDSAGRTAAQGDATLEGAQFTVRFYAVDPEGVTSASDLKGKTAARTWVVKTAKDASGDYVACLDDAHKVSGDAWYGVGTDGRALLPIGVAVVEETAAPSGYEKAAGTMLARVMSNGAVDYAYGDWSEPLGQIAEGEAAGAVGDDVVCARIEGQKVDKDTGEAVAQGDATLAGATIQLVNKSVASVCYGGKTYAKGEVVATAKTGEDGKYSFDGVPYGTYELSEAATTERGYLINSSWRKTVTVRESKTYPADISTDVHDTSVKGYVSGQKADAGLNRSEAQGDATLAGAELKIYNVSAKAVKVGGKTYEPVKDGDYAHAEAIATAVTDKDGNYRFDAELPYGTYAVKETKAPTGYLLNSDWTGKVEVRRQGETHKVEAANDVKDAAKATPTPVRGVKVDSERDEAVAQGDATLAGAEVSLYNVSANVVKVGGKEYQPVKDGKYSEATAVATAKTDEDGNYSFGVRLPYGTYTLRETKAPEGYLLNEDWSFTFSVTEQGQGWTEAADTRVNLKQDVARGGVGVVKVDAQRDEAVAEGAATLAGAKIQIRNVSAESVYVDGVEYGPGEVIDPERSPSAKLVTDGRGEAQTTADALPYGTYELTESEPSEGYLLNTEWKATLKVREDGKVVWADAHGGDGHLEEQVVRGDFNFDKIEAFSQSEMAGIPFLVTSRATGESHVVVTDANGQVDTASAFTKHSQDTNASDAALSADGKSVADESKLVRDGSAGVWFHGYADREVAVDDGLGALPYDTYDVVELAVKANAGHNLVSFTVTVTRDGVDIDKGTKEDSEVNIGTRLTYGGVEKEAPMGESVTLTDHVMFENVRRGEHTMTAVIHAVGEDGRDLGEVARATKSFTNTVTTGSVDVDIALDTTKLGGKSVVCFEYLDLSEDGKTALARHEDIADADQTVSVPNPEISTEATGSVEHDAAAEGECALTDTVSYTGLTPGKRYVLVATLHERAADGSDAGAVEGAEARVVLTPKAADGEADVRMSVDASALAGKTVVFFESLTRDEAEVASHADISDDGQSINFPALATHACEKESGEQVAEAKQSVTVIDAVSYENLTVGREYKVSGTLHVKNADGTDEGALADADGNEVTAEKTFTPEKASGTVELEFTVDASALAGKSVVAFERLSRDGVELASHADISDEEQTVRLPEAATTLTDADGKHETQVKADADGKREVELTDAVAYRNLEPGRAYKVSGTLHRRAADGTDAGAIEGCESSAEFEPEEPDGVVRVTFALDASALGEGESAVAFEVVSLVSEDGKSSREVARHEDISDEAQTVGVVDLATNASGDASGIHEEQASGKVRVRDLVSYSGLTPGREYKVSGTLHVKNPDGTDAGELTDADGDPVSAEATFTPEQSAGTVELAFTFDGSAMAGKSVVAFETLSRGGADIAVHADISDADQTVTLVSVGTEATDKATGDHTLQASEKAVVVDTVSYTGLTPGKEYMLRGELRSKTGDGGVLIGADGREVTAEKAFTPEAADGEVEVELELDASALAGQSLVAFEYLYDGDALIAKHDDLSDEAQTVTVPTLATNATDKSDGDHVVAASEKAVVVDKVSYTGLTVGKQYKVSGALHVKGEDGTDAGVLKSGGSEVTAELTFTPEKADGSVELEFEFDSSALAGKTVVAFEELSREGALVAAHADISDADQSVTVETPETPVTPPTETTTRTYYSTPRDKATLQTGIDSLAAPVAALTLAAAAVLVARRRRAGE